MIELHQFPPAWNLPNASPFCVKLEVFLKMAGLEYKNVYSMDLDKSPKGKFPYINDGGKAIGDSSLAIRYLEETYKVDVDQRLNSSERAISHAFAKMLEERFYWFLVYSRWVDDECWPDVKDLWFGKMPFPFKLFIPEMIRKKVTGNVYAQGTGRHTPEEINRMANEDMEALAHFLADKPFMMGEQPSKLDATAYGFIANLVDVPLESELKNITCHYNNLKGYSKRMKDKYFSEL